MPDWSSSAEISRDFEVLTILFWFAVGFAFREQLSTSYFDWDVITGKRQRRWPQFVYFLLKFTWWAYIVTCVVAIYSHTKIDCRRTMFAIEAMMGIVTVCSSILLACRTICVYSDTPRLVVISTVSLFAIGLAAAWAQGVTSVEAVWMDGDDPPWRDGTCTFTSVSTSYSIKYIITMAFDLTVLLLTAFGVYRLEGASTKIGFTLIRQGIFYFLVTFIVNALITGFTIAQLNPMMSLLLAVPTSAIAVAASTRLYVELAEETRPSKDREVSFTKENEESYFGTISGTSSGTHKRSMLSMFRRQASTDPEKGAQVLSFNLGSPLVEIQAPTPSHSATGGILLVQSPTKPVDDPIESLNNNVARNVSQQAQGTHSRPTSLYERNTRPSSNDNVSAPRSGAATPTSSISQRVHRKQPSLSVLPSAAAAAANVRIEESQTVTTEPMPVHLLGHTFSTERSASQQDAVAKEFPSLSRSSQGHDGSS